MTVHFQDDGISGVTMDRPGFVEMIRNLFNEWYARDISNKIKGNAGEPMGQSPYGYIKAPVNPKRWSVDDEAAQVVRCIYGMTLDGLGTEQIAAQLERDNCSPFHLGCDL